MNPSGAPDFVLCYLWDSSCSIFSLGFCVVICRSLFIFLFFFILTIELSFLLPPIWLLITPLISLMNRVCFTVFHERRYANSITNWGIVSCFVFIGCNLYRIISSNRTGSLHETYYSDMLRCHKNRDPWLWVCGFTLKYHILRTFERVHFMILSTLI